MTDDDALTCHFCGIKSIEHPTNNSTRDPVEIPQWLIDRINNRRFELESKFNGDCSSKAYIRATELMWVLIQKYNEDGL